MVRRLVDASRAAIGKREIFWLQGDACEVLGPGRDPKDHLGAVATCGYTGAEGGIAWRTSTIGFRVVR